jgi:hypothetical protein
MFTALVLVVTHILAAIGGAYAGPHIATIYTSWSGSRAVKAAQALVAKVEADAKALEAAKAVVAAAPKPATPAAPAA